MAEKVVTKIAKEAEKEAERSISSAKHEAEEIARQASEECGRIASEAKRVSAVKAGEEKDRILSNTSLEIRKAVLEKKQELMNEAFGNAVTYLRQRGRNDYVNLIKRLLLESVETGSEEVIVGEADKDIIDSRVISDVNKELGQKGNLTLSSAVAPIKGGFILRRGKIDTNLSFDGLIELAREGLETEVAKILFEE